MSAKQLVAAWQTPNLTPAVRLVLLDLADCADHEGRNAFRSEQTIASYCQLSLRTVKRALAELRRRRLITIQELPRQRRSTTYQLNLLLQGCQIVTAKNRSGVTLGVTNIPLRGDKSHIRTYKDDPGIDPGDPRLPALMTALQALMRQHPGCSVDFLHAKLSEEFGPEAGDQLVLTAIKRSRGYAR